MKLKFLGSDSGFGQKNNSAYYETDNKLVIIDCGFTVFNIIKDKFDLKKYEAIEVIITHLHNDHAGSLSQLVLYSWFVLQKEITIISKCKHIKEYLKITGAPKNAYEIKCSTPNIKFIKTQHVRNMDCYGFMLTLDGESIIYTGDTSTLKPFEPYFNRVSKIYLDVSASDSGVHLYIDEIIPILDKLKSQGKSIHLMHIDDREYISSITSDKFIIE